MPDLEDHERKVYGPALEVPELGREPSYLPYFRQLNHIITALAHLVGKYGNKSVLLQADAAGKLLVNTGDGGGVPAHLAGGADHTFSLNTESQLYHDFTTAAARVAMYWAVPGMTDTYALMYDADSIGGGQRPLPTVAKLAGGVCQVVTVGIKGQYIECYHEATGGEVWGLAWDI